MNTCKEMLLTKDRVALVDKDDFAWLNKWKWSCSSHGYACRGTTKAGNKRNIFYMHREIMKAPEGMDIDHINGNRLDNRRDNLRICSRSENMFNFMGRENKSSKFKGVHWNKKQGRWVVQISENKKVRHLGSFKDEIEAGRVYDKAAIKAHGKFAGLNFSDFGCIHWKKKE